MDDWTTTAPGDLSTVRALRLTSTASYQPAQGFRVTVNLTTPAVGASQIAWNTFGAVATNSVTGVPLPAAESNKVGLTRADYSHLSFEKTVLSIGGISTTEAGPGSVINYNITAINDGVTPAENVVMDDELPAVPFRRAIAFYQDQELSPVDGHFRIPIGTLQPGASYSVQVTILLGYGALPDQLVNRLRVDSSVPSGPTPETTCPDDPTRSCASVPVDQNPRLVIHKKVDRTEAVPGDELTYTISVSNPGRVAAGLYMIYDLIPMGTDFVSSAPAGETENLGTSAQKMVSVPLGKGDDPYLMIPAGATVDVATVKVRIADGQWGRTLVNGVLGLAGYGLVGGDNTCPAEYATDVFGDPVTAADYDSGLACASTTTPAQGPAIDLVKTASSPANGVAHLAGETVTYTFTATNTGNTPLSGVTLSEGQFTNGSGAPLALTAAPTVTSPSPFDGTLAPGATVTWQATYQLTQADVDAAGQISNSATVSGQPPVLSDGSTPPPVTDTDQAKVPVAHPAIKLVKTATSQNRVGGKVAYTFTVTNTGTVPLTDLTLREDSFTDAQGKQLKLDAAPRISTPVGFTGPLAPGGVVVFTAEHTLTQAEIDEGQTLLNTATVTGRPTYDAPPVSSTDSAEVPVTNHGPAISLEKSASQPGASGAFEPGQVVTYTFTATNTGDVTLRTVSLAEKEFVDAAGNPVKLDAAPVVQGDFDGTLAPGTKVTWTATHRVTLAEATAGGWLHNVAVATGSTSNGDPVTASDDAAVNVRQPQAPTPPGPPGPTTPTTPGPTTPAQPGPPGLASTGAPGSALLVLGMVAVIGGAGLLRRRR